MAATFCVNEMVNETIVLLQSHIFWGLMTPHSATSSFFRVRASVPPLAFIIAVPYISCITDSKVLSIDIQD